MSRRRLHWGCTVESCDRPHSARGLCKLHYHRRLVFGSPDQAGVVARGEQVCRGCDEPFAMRARGRPLVACSRRCRDRLRAGGTATREEWTLPPLRTCPRCGRPHFRRKFCSRACYRVQAPVRTIQCGTCGTAVETRRRRQRYCSPACRATWRDRPSRLNQHNRRRILNRDGWICYLCSRPIPHELRWPHPLSGTVDHVIPASAGGSDRDDNLRAAHWHCNEAKGDQLPGIEVWVPREVLA
jgi:5-methylcytosine-specific restriction endonuclease McrA